MGLQPEALLRELAETIHKSAEGLRQLGRLSGDRLALGPTPKEPVYREDKIVLYRYTPVIDPPHPVPLLIVYSLVNRPTLVDLHESRSLVRSLLALGIDVYLIDWGYPTRADRWLTLDDYIGGYVHACADTIRARHGLDAISLLGICQGGVFALCYAALYPNRVNALITMVTPVDFHAGNSVISRWAGRDEHAVHVDRVVDALGNIPGDVLNMGFLMREPFGQNVSKYVGLLDMFEDERKLLNFLRVEKWSFDSPDQAGEAFRQFVKECYQGNKLVQGTMMLGRRRVNLRRITMPVLNLHAQYDDLVPPASVEPLAGLIGTADYTAHCFPVGHIGMYLSSRVYQALPPLIAEWLKARG